MPDNAPTTTTPKVQDVASTTSFIPNTPPGIYIPPPTVRVRIIGYASRTALFYDPSQHDYLDQQPMSAKHDGYWFYVIPVPGWPNFYRIKSDMNGYLISSKQSGGKDSLYMSQLSSSLIAGMFGALPDMNQLFRFIPGEGRLSKWFQIAGSANTFLFNRNYSADPVVGSYYRPDHPELNDDQFFQFEVEEMRVKKIDYQIERGVLGSGHLVTMLDQDLDNTRGDRDQTTNVTVTTSLVEQSSWDASVGLSTTISAETTGGVPEVAQEKISLSVTASAEYKMGGVNTTTRQLEISVPVTMTAGKKYNVCATVMQGMLDVPYTAHLISDSTGYETEISGTYHGVTNYHFAASYAVVT